MEQIQGNIDLEIGARPGVHEDVMKYIFKYVNTGSNIFEIGAGSGAFSLRMKNSGFNVIASDIRDHAFLVKDIPYINIDITKELPIEHAEKYDAVVAIEVIEHVENIYDFLIKINTLLKNDGVAFITTPNILEIGSRLKFLISGEFTYITEEYFDTMGHIQVIPSWLLLKACEKVRLDVKEIVGIGAPRTGWRRIIVSSSQLLHKMLVKERYKGEISKLISLLIITK